MNSNLSKTRFLTRTAVLLALTIVFQMVGRMIPNNNFIVGPLVNACLIISTAMAGVWSGVTIAVLSPFTSLINNHAPVAAALLPFAPIVALGNIVLVVSYYLLQKKSALAGVFTGSILKFGVLFAGISLFLRMFSFPKFAKVLTFLFGWPQLLTALIGGLLALAVIAAMKRNKVDLDSTEIAE